MESSIGIPDAYKCLVKKNTLKKYFIVFFDNFNNKTKIFCPFNNLYNKFLPCIKKYNNTNNNTNIKHENVKYYLAGTKKRKKVTTAFVPIFLALILFGSLITVSMTENGNNILFIPNIAVAQKATEQITSLPDEQKQQQLVTCPDGSQKPAGKKCPSAAPPQQQIITCPDGSQIPAGKKCPSAAPPQQQIITCPDGSQIPAGKKCPSAAPPQQKPFQPLRPQQPPGQTIIPPPSGNNITQPQPSVSCSNGTKPVNGSCLVNPLSNYQNASVGNLKVIVHIFSDSTNGTDTAKKIKPPDITVHVLGNNPSPSSFLGKDSSGTLVSLGEGTYKVLIEAGGATIGPGFYSPSSPGSQPTIAPATYTSTLTPTTATFSTLDYHNKGAIIPITHEPWHQPITIGGYTFLPIFSAGCSGYIRPDTPAICRITLVDIGAATTSGYPL